MVAEDLRGQKFTRLTPINRIPGTQKHPAKWECLCDCGKTSYVRAADLKGGHVKSCGCYHLDNIKNSPLYHREGNRTKEYKTWVRMRSRCQREKDPQYFRYGGRGIKVCDRWDNSYTDFLSDMGRAPSPLHSIERIEVNGNYEPLNCRWATWKEQANNRTNSALIEHDGKSITLKQLAEILNIEYWFVHDRIHNKHLTIEEMKENYKHKRRTPRPKIIRERHAESNPAA